jgi:subtilase family serine protease
MFKNQKGRQMNRLQRLVWMMAMMACTVIAANPLCAQTLTAASAQVKAKTKTPVVKNAASPLPPGPDNPQPGGGALPDLQIGVIKITPTHPGENQTVTFEGNVMNYGAGSATNPVAMLTVDSPAGVHIHPAREQFVTLGKNQGVTMVHKFKVPLPGSYTCTFTLDPGRTIAETDETNNVKKLTFNVDALPDLVVCISNGKRPPVGGEREIDAVVKNIGHEGCADYIKLRLYVEEKGAQVYDLLPIAKGDSRKVTRKCSWSTSGTKKITAKIIYPKINNEVQGSYFVRLPHHDQYSTAPQVKCSNNRSFNSWEECDNNMR